MRVDFGSVGDSQSQYPELMNVRESIIDEITVDMARIDKSTVKNSRTILESHLSTSLEATQHSW